MFNSSRMILTFFSLSLLLACNGAETLDLRVLNTGGSLLASFEVEVADDTLERSQGLMFRQSLGEDEGMLFIFQADTEGAFWMRNTLIPLDIIFVESKKRIVNVVANATPQTDTPRLPEGPYRYVLEINGGQAASLGLSSGSLLDW